MIYQSSDAELVLCMYLITVSVKILVEDGIAKCR